MSDNVFDNQIHSLYVSPQNRQLSAKKAGIDLTHETPELRRIADLKNSLLLPNHEQEQADIM